uniref:GON domain-containing protein n=1 Tax=Caenorhabditis japonica TaxID=281687 RepID=A0A8R1IJH4_CAEJA
MASSSNKITHPRMPVDWLKIKNRDVSLVQDAFGTRTYWITSRDCFSSISQPRKIILADCCTRGRHSL